jgi:hypothetical protein
VSSGGRAVLLSVFVAMSWSPAFDAHATDALSAETSHADEQALKYLKSLPRKWSGTSDRDCKTYEDKNIERLSRSFAVSAARFLQAFVEVHGHVTITSAHRTAQEQACVCEGEKGPCAGRPRVVKTKRGRRIVKRSASRHQDGIALDVRPGTGTDDEFVCMHEFAQFNPQFGVRFPLGKRDRPHMEPAASYRRHLRIAAIGVIPRQVMPCARLKVILVDTLAD